MEKNYDDYLKDVGKHSTKPVRQEADFSNYQVVDFVDQASGKIKHKIIDHNSMRDDNCSQDILEMLKVYQVKNVIIYDDVADYALDLKPDVFDGVEDLIINKREEKEDDF